MYLNIPFEDEHLDFQTFGALKMGGKLQFGQVPVLYVWKKDEKFEDATQIAQSFAILRFISQLADKNEFYPRCPIKAAQVDAMIYQNADCFSAYYALNYKDRNGMAEMSKEDQAKYKQSISENVFKAQFKQLEKLLGDNEWLAGTSGPSIADFSWVNSLMTLQKGGIGDPTALDGFDKLKALVDRLMGLDEFKEYYKDHKFVMFG